MESRGVQASSTGKSVNAADRQLARAFPCTGTGSGTGRQHGSSCLLRLQLSRLRQNLGLSERGMLRSRVSRIINDFRPPGVEPVAMESRGVQASSTGKSVNAADRQMALSPLIGGPACGLNDSGFPCTGTGSGTGSPQHGSSCLLRLQLSRLRDHPSNAKASARCSRSTGSASRRG